MSTRRAALLAAFVLACAGCAGEEETYDAEDVRRAFSTQGISLWASDGDGYVNLVPYEPAPNGTTNPPQFYVGVFHDGRKARRAVSGEAEWEVVVVTVSYPGDPPPPVPKDRRLRRARNVVIDYDAADRTTTRRIAAALRALENESR